MFHLHSQLTRHEQKNWTLHILLWNGTLGTEHRLSRVVPIFYLCGNCANEWHLSSGTCDIWSLTPNLWKIVTLNTAAFYSVILKKLVACFHCCLNLFLSSWTITQLLQLSSPLINFLFLCLSSLSPFVSHISISLLLSLFFFFLSLALLVGMTTSSSRN